MATKTTGVLINASRSSDQGPGLAVVVAVCVWPCIHAQLQKPAAGACTMAWVRDTHNGKGHVWPQELGSTVGTPAAAGALAVSMYSCGYRVSPQACTQQARLVIRVSPTEYRCTAEGA